ncbi:signal peptide peptidase SppA [Merismopedia glauca]|uniref:Protease 4 n=1 Tax=Merismopedia glauca CCAP 1448/3 TaxID=1296344 RepID=A0A2T1C5E7_9CYAN|nr:signal peptide peptidase SppA [Merismopedia glauca]PSB03505.1 signal peptide peptidase SppA [Merismopedia glauca CCAP 1448/3]
MRNFLKQTLASTIGSCLGLLLFGGFATFGLIFLLVNASLKETTPVVENKSVLIFDLSLNITDSNPKGGDTVLATALSGDSGDSLSLRQVVNAIDKASKDSRISALFIDGSGGNPETGNGLASLREIRSALDRFKASGKQILAYDVGMEKRDYYLSSVANQIWMNPYGELEMNGWSTQPVFFAKALQKYGIGVQVVRVGKYKSAVEPFLLNQLSPENRQQLQALLNDLWQEFLTTTATSRKLTPQQLQTLADTQGVLSAEEAKQKGLVDKVAYVDEVRSQLQKISETKDEKTGFAGIELKEYVKQSKESSQKSFKGNRIAVVYAEGEIVNGTGKIGEVGGDRFAKKLRQLRLDNDVKAVVLRVNSPGGSVIGSDIIQREVLLIQKSKPLVVSMGDVAASGGYWISTYSDRIFAEKGTITGSIGVFGLLPNIQKLANDNGVSWDVVKTSKFADIDAINRPKTPEELAIYQKQVNRTYQTFITKVAESRKIAPDKVAEIAQGRVWSGKEAKNLGLVDEIGGLDRAIDYAAKKAKLEGKFNIEEYPESRSFEERILEQLTGDSATTQTQLPIPLNSQLKKIQKDLAVLKYINSGFTIYARLPFSLEIE